MIGLHLIFYFLHELKVLGQSHEIFQSTFAAQLSVWGSDQYFGMCVDTIRNGTAHSIFHLWSGSVAWYVFLI